MFQQAIPRSFLWVVSFYAALIIGIIGCGDSDEAADDNHDSDEAADDNQWAGTWAVESINSLNYEMFWASLGYSVTTNNITFHDDGTFDIEVTIEGLATTKSMGTYSLSGSNYTASGFNVSTTAEEETGSDESTGTWSRSGDTLTINSDDGTTIVFKRK